MTVFVTNMEDALPRVQMQILTDAVILQMILLVKCYLAYFIKLQIIAEMPK